MADTPLMDDLPDTVVTTIRNDRVLYDRLYGAVNVSEKEQVLNNALQIVGNRWLQFNEVRILNSVCQHLRGWLELREMDDLFARCVRAVDLEFEHMHKEA